MQEVVATIFAGCMMFVLLLLCYVVACVIVGGVLSLVGLFEPEYTEKTHRFRTRRTYENHRHFLAHKGEFIMFQSLFCTVVLGTLYGLGELLLWLLAAV